MKLAFDFGITNTDVVSYKDGEMKFFTMPSETINNNFLDKLLLNAEIELKDIDAIAVTGGKSSDLEDTFKNIPIVKVNEVEAIGYGAKDLYNISESNYLVVSCGTGTACVASIDNEFHHMGGISVGGGTLQGLSNLILGEENAEKINTLAADGNKDNLDSLIGEVVNDIGALYPEITAVISGYKAPISLTTSPISESKLSLFPSAARVLIFSAFSSPRIRLLSPCSVPPPTDIPPI